MLQISKALSASKLQDYHKREFTSPDQNYWSQGQQVQGQWQGQLADKFGLSGAEARKSFSVSLKGNIRTLPSSLSCTGSPLSTLTPMERPSPPYNIARVEMLPFRRQSRCR